MAETPLLDWTPQTHRLYRKPGTSSQAAAGAAMTGAERRRMILERLAIHPSTPDEVAEHFGWVVNTARARMSELARPMDAEGNRLPPLIVPTGARRTASGGRLADVMRVTTREEREGWHG